MRPALVLATVPFWSLFVEEAGEWAPQRAAQVRQESGFNPAARSPVGARGIGQHMPANWPWYQELGWIPNGADPWDVRMGLRATHRFMSYLYDRTRGWVPALAAYNAGEGRVRKARARVLARGLIDTPERNLWLAEMPAETQHYCQVIPGKHLAWVQARMGR